MDTKICTKCGDTLPLDSFYKKKRGGTDSTCKKCNNLISKLYHQKNRDKVLKTQKEYYLKNREELLIKKKLYNEINSGHIHKKQIEYRRSPHGRGLSIKANQRYLNTIEGRINKRLRNKEWKDRNKEKDLAHCSVYRAIKKGVLKPQPCEFCGYTTTEAHHDNYNYPLDIRWLCREHHNFIHRRVT